MQPGTGLSASEPSSSPTMSSQPVGTKEKSSVIWKKVLVDAKNLWHMEKSAGTWWKIVLVFRTFCPAD